MRMDDLSSPRIASRSRDTSSGDLSSERILFGGTVAVGASSRAEAAKETVMKAEASTGMAAAAAPARVAVAMAVVWGRWPGPRMLSHLSLVQGLGAPLQLTHSGDLQQKSHTARAADG